MECGTDNKDQVPLAAVAGGTRMLLDPESGFSRTDLPSSASASASVHAHRNGLFPRLNRRNPGHSVCHDSNL